MFNVFQVSTFMTIMIYGLFCDFRILLIWGLIMLVYHLMPIIIGAKITNVRQVVRIGTWDVPRDPSTFMKIEIDLTEATKWLEKKNAQNNGTTYSLTHIVLKCIGQAFKENPETLGKIVFGSFVRLDSCDINTLIDIGGKDLGQLTVKNCDKLTITEIANSMKGKVGVIKSNKSKSHNDKVRLLK